METFDEAIVTKKAATFQMFDEAVVTEKETRKLHSALRPQLHKRNAARSKRLGLALLCRLCR
jgi:hypothetical protein